MREFVIITLLSCFLATVCFSSENPNLNRTHFLYKKETPSVPLQSKDYINIANYNCRTSKLDKKSSNEWEKRKNYYLQSIRAEDDAHQILQQMQITLQRVIAQHLSESATPCVREKHCVTCSFSEKEPYPILETNLFRIALKTSYDKNQSIYANSPYPYRLIVVLKRHAPYPNEEELTELFKIIRVLDGGVREELGAEYTSYAVFQDVYHSNKKAGKTVSSTPHFFLHFIFRFPEGIKIRDVQFKDPNPFDQFVLRNDHFIQEEAVKKDSNFIYRRSPDIINTQEATLEQVSFLKENLPKHELIGYSAKQGLTLDQIQPDTWTNEILAIAYRKDRFECLDHGVRWISPTPLIASVGYGASRERIVIWAKFLDLRTKQIFYMFNAHYDHLNGKYEYVDAETDAIKEIAGDQLWFAVGERFYQSHNGENQYQHYLDSIKCNDVRDIALLGHFGEAGSWGGFENDPFRVGVQEGIFDCDTLDICFTNAKKNQILFSYAYSGAYDPKTQEMYQLDSLVKNSWRIASDHFMIGFYVILEDNE